MAKKERMQVPGNRLVETVEELARDPASRQVCVLNEEKHLLDVPLAIKDPASPASALAGPILEALRAIGSLFSECTVEVEKAEPKEKRRK